MGPDTKARRHGTRVGDNEVAGSPNAIDRLAAPEKCRSYLLSCELPNYLVHIEPLDTGEGASDRFFINVFICIHTDYEAVTVLSPFLELPNEVIMKLLLRACGVLPRSDKEPLLLLIGSPAVELIIATWVVSAYEFNPGLATGSLRHRSLLHTSDVV